MNLIAALRNTVQIQVTRVSQLKNLGMVFVK